MWLENTSTKRVLIRGTVLYQKALSLYTKTLVRDPLKWVTLNHLQQARVGYTDSGAFGLKNIKITGEAASANEEAGVMFLTELKKVIKDKGYHPKKSSVAMKPSSFGRRCPVESTFISAKEVPGHKMWKDRLTLLLCGNAVGHILKPSVVYRVKNYVLS